MASQISFDNLVKGEKKGPTWYLILENCSHPGATQILYAQHPLYDSSLASKQNK